MLETAWNKAVENIRGVDLGGASGSEAVRQAKMNTNSMAEKPNKVEIENDNKINNRR